MLNWFKKKSAAKTPDATLPVADVAPRQVTVKGRGDEHVKAGRYADAERCYREVMESDPQYSDALVMLGFVLREQGRADEAREVLERAVLIADANADAHYLLGSILSTTGPRDVEVSHLQRAVDLRPDFELARRQLIAAQQSLSRLLLDNEQLERAEASYRREIELTPEHFGPYHMLGVVLNRVGRNAEAIESFKRAIALNPNSGASYSSLAASYIDLDDSSEKNLALAQANIEQAAMLEPQNSAILYSLGVSYWRAARLDLALASFDRAIEIDPDNAKARWGRVMLWAPAFTSQGGDDSPDRSGFADELAKFEDWWVKSDCDGAGFVGELQPFFLTYQEENNLALLEPYGRVCAMAMQRWLARQTPPAFQRPLEKRVRLGIVSADIRLHSNWLALIKGWFESFDRGRFELVVFSLSDRADAQTAWARTKADVFVSGLTSLSQWVAAIREQNCEILLYPAVGLDPPTLKLASLRLAPVQMNTWGHADTSGLPTLDYYVSADCFEPAAAQDHYSEQLMLLPHLGNRLQPLLLTDSDPDFAAMNIDLAKPILVCPGTPYKYQPAHDHVFTEIARRVPDAQLVFFLGSGAALANVLQNRITKEFEAAGLEVTDHVRFIRWLNFNEFHCLLRHATVMLDTIGFSGYNTAVQAIECGLPLVTREGRFLRGRLASAVLRRMDLPELIVPTKTDYVDLVARLVADRPYRARIRSEIQRLRPVLFDDRSAMDPFQDWLESVARPTAPV
jgi:protein O-GlcNAc transferase